MTSAEGFNLEQKLEKSGRWAALAATFLAVVGFAGWVAGVKLNEAHAADWLVLCPAAAFGLLAAGLTLIVLQRGGAGARRAAYAAPGALALVVLALLFLPQAATLPGGGMPVYIGVTLLLLLAAASAAYAGRPGLMRLAYLFAGAAAGLVYIVLIGTSFRTLVEGPSLMNVSFLGLAIMALLAYGTIAGSAGPWLLERFSSERPGAVITRQLLPAILALPLVLSWLRLLGERLGLFDAEFGALLLTVVTIVALGVLVLWGAETVDRLDARRTDAERQAHAQREWLRVTLASCSDAVVATDPQGHVRLVNHAAEAVLGKPAHALIGLPVQDAVPLTDESESSIAHPLRDVLRSQAGTAGYSELVLRNGDGTLRYVEVSVAPIHDDAKSLLGAVMVMRDVSVRRQSEQALRAAYAELDHRVAERTAELEQANSALHESLALLRGVTESTPDLIYVKDREGRLVMANPATIKAIGRPEREILGRTDRDFFGDPAQAEQLMENDRRVMTTGRIERIEELLTTPEGLRTYLSTKSPLRDVSGSIIGLIGVATDITERKRIENELRDAQRFTQGLLETAPIILYLFDPLQRRFVYASGMGLAALGYLPADLLKASPRQLVRRVHPDDLQRLQAHQNAYESMRESLRELEFRYRHHEGDWRWLHARERLFEPGSGQRLVLGVAVDITDRKRAELERERLMAVEQRLRFDAERANRAKDEFLAIVSHELRSPLNALRGWGFLLGNARPLEAALVERATSAIKRNVDQQARLIDDLLDTSRIMSGKLTIERRPVDVSDVVATALEVVRASAAAKRIGLQVQGDTPRLRVEGDPARLNQVFVNLLSNAVKFTPEGGEIALTIYEEEGRAKIAVSDTGAGIAEDFLPRVFDRFSQADTSTTRRHGGLGIGLALVRHLAELHGGTVRAESAGPGKGATFTVELPLVAAETSSAHAPRAEVRPIAGNALSGMRICALDDDPDARDVISLTLKQAGAEVHTVATGAELIALLDRRLPADAPDVLLMDLAMPDEDGFSVLEKVRALERAKMRDAQRTIPAIAVTAFTELSRSRITQRGFVDHVNKPIEPGKLVATIRAAIQASEPLLTQSATGA